MIFDVTGRQVIQIEKQRLLETLVKNREQHRGVFLEACDGYRKMAVQRIEAMLADAKMGRDIQQSVGLWVPQDHTRDYDRVIAMLQYSVNSLATLTEEQFAHYVQDDWSWQRAFLTSAGSYSVSACSGAARYLST